MFAWNEKEWRKSDAIQPDGETAARRVNPHNSQSPTTQSNIKQDETA